MESLSMQLQPFFEWLLRTTLQASLLICLILLFQVVLRSRLGARWHYCLWLLLLIRMAMPWAPQSRLSVFNLIPQSLPQRQTEYARQEVGDDSADSDVADKSTAESTTVSTTGIPQDSPEAITATPQIRNEAKGRLKPVVSEVANILPLVWLAGALILAVYVCAGNFNLLRIVKGERPLTDQKILDLLEDCKAEMGIRIILGVVATDKVKSPALFGFIRPRLLLPKGMLDTLSREELRYVFLHELAHLKRHDIYIGWLMSLLQVLHWFNPLIWLAFYRVRTDRELACDALVLARTQSGQAKDYGRTIVNLLERFSRSQRLPAMAGILETKAQLKRRITMISRFKKNSYQWSPLAVILIIILACISLPDAKHTKASGISSTKRITLRQVWSGPEVDLLGAPSPDGRYLSYVDWDTGDLAIYEIANEKKRRLTNKGSLGESIEFALFSRWSPDGRQIVYDWYNDEKEFADLCIIGLDGSKPRILYSNEEVVWLQTYDWSPDGRQILACFSRKDGEDQIVLVSVADGSARVLKTLDKFYPKNMCFSPDGSYIVYSYQQKESSPYNDIFLLSTDGGHEIPLVEHPADDFVLGWAPDGKNILFANDRTGNFDVWVIKVADGKPQGPPKLVKQGIGRRCVPLGFTQKGSFYYGITKGTEDVYIAELEPKTGKILVPPKKAVERFEGSNIAPYYSPDGKYLAYISRLGLLSLSPGRSRRHIHCVRSLETGKERDFTFNLNLVSSTIPRWSPDCRSLLARGTDSENRKGIFQIDAQTGDVKLIVPQVRERGISFRSCEWSRDGKAIFYGHLNNSKLCRIMVRDLESGTEKELYRSSSEFYSKISVSPDGKWLALRSQQPNNYLRSLKVMPVTGGEPRELCRFEKRGEVGSFAWTADGKYILFVRKIPGNLTELCRIPVEGGEIEKLGLEMRQISSLSVHPDGRHIAFQSSGFNVKFAEVWVMENFLPGTPVAKPEPTPTLRQVGESTPSPLYSPPSLDGKYICRGVGKAGNLVVRELTTGKERPVTHKSSWDESVAYALESVISPDSSKVAYVWFDQADGYSLCVIGLDGSDRRILCKNEYIVPLGWSWDGERILGGHENQVVWVLASDGSVEVIKQMDGWPYRLSRDGRYLAYSRSQNGTKPQKDVFVFDLETNREVLLTQNTAEDRFLDWTPDGKSIFFASNRLGSWDGWLIRVVDGKAKGVPELILPRMGDCHAGGFTRDGDYYFTILDHRDDVYLAEVDLKAGKILSEPKPILHAGKEGSPTWSPDGHLLAYCSRRPADKSQIIRIRSVQTRQERVLDANLPYFNDLRWCPDGRYLLASSMPKGVEDAIYKIDSHTGKRTTLVRSQEHRIGRAMLSVDSKRLFYRKDDSIVVRDLQTSEEKTIQKGQLGDNRLHWDLSPDGKILVCLLRDQGRVIKLISVETGDSKELLRINHRTRGITWTPDGELILYMKGKELRAIPATGGEPRVLWEWRNMPEYVYAPKFHPDGRRIAMDTFQRENELWVMENFLPTGVSQAK